jgi:threonine/homoserine/homoserine lactone efflux protein
VVTFSRLPAAYPPPVDRNKEERMAQDLSVLLVGAGLILLGFDVLIAVVAVGVAVRRPAPWYGAARLIGRSLAWMLVGAAIASVIARPSHTRDKPT